VLLVLALCLCSCSQERKEPQQNAEGEAPADTPTRREADAPVFGLFVANSGLGDRGFMDAIYQGALEARQRHSAVLLMETQPRSSSPQKEAAVLETLVQQGATLIICSSSSMQQGMDLAARSHPETTFVLLDSPAQEYLPNVSSATFATEQAAFLAGALAARMSRSKSLGIIAGRRLPPVMDFVLGFEEGARHVMPTVPVKTLFIADHDPGSMVWNNPDAAWELASRLREEFMADIIFPVAGASGIGVFNYVADRDLYAIGVDTDQDYMAPGHILTSVLKRLDVAVAQLVDKYMQGRLLPRDHRFTLADGGVGLSPMLHTREMIPQDVQQLLGQLREDIIAGRIVVPASTAVQTAQFPH